MIQLLYELHQENDALKEIIKEFKEFCKINNPDLLKKLEQIIQNHTNNNGGIPYGKKAKKTTKEKERTTEEMCEMRHTYKTMDDTLL
ncbi:MAG: hypothetical protein ACFFCI_00905 [Promethearchaeota archaeon]